MAAAKKGSKPASKESKVPANETKPQRFVRLATQRVPRAIKAIQSVGKLTGASYEFTPEQAKKITDALSAEVRRVSDKFSGTKETVTGFTL